MRHFNFLLLPLLLVSCKTTIPVSESVRTEYVERLVPYALPPDSATLIALLECDSNGVVLLKSMDMLTSKNAKLLFQLDSMGRLMANMTVAPDTIFITQKETTTDKSKETVVYVEKEDSAFDKLQKRGFWIFLAVIAIFLVIKYKSVLCGVARRLFKL